MALTDALALAAGGWTVFPLREKAAFLPGGFHIATTDPERIVAWWRRYPGANIGIRPAVDTVVLDVDPRDHGAANLVRWLDGRRLPPTLTVTTGRGDGGLHAWFRAPVPDPVRDLVPGVQVKGHGTGYVVGPPSIHPDTGGRYTWDNALPIAEAPAWLVGGCRKPPPPPVHPVAPPSGPHQGGRLEGLVRVVLAASPGERNERLNWAAYTGRDLDHAEIAGALLRAAAEVGLPVREAERTIRSGLSGARS